MDRQAFENMWRDTLRQADSHAFEPLARGVVDLYSHEGQFREHLKNRSKSVFVRTGIALDHDRFDLETARAYIADELGFTAWSDLMTAVDDHSEINPIMFRYAVAAMERGDFSALESAIGPENFYEQIRGWHKQGLFLNEHETLDEVLSAACMLGQTETAAFLLDVGVGPYAGMKTWLAGPHYAASSGRLEVIKMLLDKKIPLEVENKYGGTVLGQALWSAVNEHTDAHAEIIRLLIEAGAVIEPGTLRWWLEQEVPSAETKSRVAEALRKAEGK